MKPKITFADWENAIREARAFVNRYDKVRWKVVDIALRVCDLNKGGRKLEHVFSIHKFALAIDLNPKTLYQWIKIKKKVVDKLPDTELKDKSKYNFSDLADVAERLADDASKKDVLTQWQEQLRLPAENKRFLKYETHLNALIYNANRPANLMLVDTHIIENIEKKSRLLSNLFNIELELRKKFTNEKRLLGREKQIAEAIGEIKISNEAMNKPA